MNWPHELADFVRRVEGPLSVVLNADGCREGWLQAELYRYFHPVQPAFRVNQSLSDGRVKHDLVCLGPSPMVGELKVYGQSGYYQKNLHGRSNIDQFVPESPDQRVCITAAQLAELQPTGGFLHDVHRLHQLQDVATKVMVLIIQRASEPDRFGAAITAIKVSDEEVEYVGPYFIARVWQLNKSA